MLYLGKVFGSLINKIQSFLRFKNFWRFQAIEPMLFGATILFGAIEPIRKEGNNG